MKSFLVATRTVMGVVTATVDDESLKDPGGASQTWFEVETRGGNTYRCYVSGETTFQVLTNIDGLDRDRVPTPERVGEGEDAPKFDAENLTHRIYKYTAKGVLIVVRGVYQEHQGQERFDARTVYLLDSKVGNFLFETDHWWLTQLERLADGWLDVLFGDRRDYGEADFAELYRTRLNILGFRTDDATQEMATLSRLIYGFSSAYLLTGVERYRLAAEAGVKYQREAFRCLDGQDGARCVWASAKRKSEHGRVAKTLFPSQSPDDFNQIPLYEQIYALAGLAQYYRITNDPAVLSDILRTVRAFNYYWKDAERGGYYSHIDYATFSPDSDILGDNRLKKNWNSIGDHIPAYLVNLLLAIEPIPLGRQNDRSIRELLEACREILRETCDLIVHKFPGNKSRFVKERFFENWEHDRTWRWQQNRGIVGHNLKIAWNLTRAANYLKSANDEALHRLADDALREAEKLGRDMSVHGLDMERGGCFDALEREPANGMPYEVTWLPTKDFWQQEQGILAYLILYGHTRDEDYLELAREMEAFWNLFFLDRDRWGIYFRVQEDGSPIVEGTYGDKGGHSVSGYHSFELNFLAHIYNRMYLGQVSPQSETPQPGRLCLFFKPCPNLRLDDNGETTINCLPDFFLAGDIKLVEAQIGGISRELTDDEKQNFRVRLGGDDLGEEVVVVLESCVPEDRGGLESLRAGVEPVRHRSMKVPARLPVPVWQHPKQRWRSGPPDG